MTPTNRRSVNDLCVFVVGGGSEYIQMFNEAGFKGAESVTDADIICFTGGEDVDPDLYGETPLPNTHFNRARDDLEVQIYSEAVASKKPMVGICRGAQFLNVMNGGSLWQHVQGHAVRRGHGVKDMVTGEWMEGMTSTHHQMMRPANKGAEIIALACESTLKQSAKETVKRKKPELDDVEVVWYPKTLTLCFQPHPEFYHGECRNYFLGLVDRYLLPAFDDQNKGERLENESCCCSWLQRRTVNG